MNQPNQLYPVFDGIDPSWADVKVEAQVNGGPLITMDDIASITGSSTVEVGVRKGASGGRVRGRTTGEKTDEFSWTLYRSGFDKLIRNLRTLAPKRGQQRLVSLVHFNIHTMHTPPGSDSIYEYIVRGARVLAWTMNHAEGTDADQVEVPISIIEFAHLIDGEEIVLL